MANMFPKQLSPAIREHWSSRNEAVVYDALSSLGDEFDVFYNRFPDAGTASLAFKNRVDFIVLHERLGLLGIEVKGGRIRFTGDGFEQFHPSKNHWAAINPHLQVERAIIKLVKTCKADGANYWIPSTVAVVFPKTTRVELGIDAGQIPAATLCSDDLDLFPVIIPTLFEKLKRERAWPRDAYLDMQRRLQTMPEFKPQPAPQPDTTMIGRIKERWLPKPVVDPFDDWDPEPPVSSALQGRPSGAFDMPMPTYRATEAPFRWSKEIDADVQSALDEFDRALRDKPETDLIFDHDVHAEPLRPTTHRIALDRHQIVIAVAIGLGLAFLLSLSLRLINLPPSIPGAG